MFHWNLSAAALSIGDEHAKVALTWEEYAREHFHGRLLPGCCNMGCTNLSGLSEAALVHCCAVGACRQDTAAWSAKRRRGFPGDIATYASRKT